MRVIDGPEHKIIEEPISEFRQGNCFGVIPPETDPRDIPSVLGLPKGLRIDDWHNGQLWYEVVPRAGYTQFDFAWEGSVLSNKEYCDYFNTWDELRYVPRELPYGFLMGFPILRWREEHILAVHLAANWAVADDSSSVIPLEDIAQIYQYDPEFSVALADQQVQPDGSWEGDGIPPSEWDVVTQKLGNLAVPKLIYNRIPTPFRGPNEYYQ